MAIDPVCGMQVDEKSPVGTYEYKGKTYYFCSPGCKVAFSKDSEKYLHHEGTHAATNITAAPITNVTSSDDGLVYPVSGRH